MKKEIKKLHKVWEASIKAKQHTELAQLNLQDLLSSVFTAGPTYYYIIDFFDMKISNMTPSVKEIHGLDPETITFDDILSMIHPDDVEYVSRAEQKLNELFNHQIGRDKMMKYKFCYSLRFKTADGSYKLFLHQAVVLTMDEEKGFGKSLNIHTDISHIADSNNHKLSVIGLMGEPSFTNIEVFQPAQPEPSGTIYSKREVEIIKLIGEGFTNAEISERLYIAIDTVKNHRKNIMSKANVKNSAQLVRKSIQEGLI
jgi:DNA-binding CsgD family transcriptional regulator